MKNWLSLSQINKDIDKSTLLTFIGIKSEDFVFYQTDDGEIIEEISYSNFSRKATLPKNDCTKVKSDGTWDPVDQCNFQQFCTVCEFEDSPPLLLRGLCHDTPLNWVNFLRVNDDSKEIYYEGYIHTRIEFSDSTWRIKERPSFDSDGSNLFLPTDVIRQYPIGSKL